MTIDPDPPIEYLAQSLRDMICAPDFDSPDQFDAKEADTLVYALTRVLLEHNGFRTMTGLDLTLLSCARGEHPETTQLDRVEHFAGRRAIGIFNGDLLRQIVLCRYDWSRDTGMDALRRAEQFLNFGNCLLAGVEGSLVATACLFLIPARSQQGAFDTAEEIGKAVYTESARQDRLETVVHPITFIAGFRTAQGDIPRVGPDMKSISGFDVIAAIWRMR